MTRGRPGIGPISGASVRRRPPWAAGQVPRWSPAGAGHESVSGVTKAPALRTARYARRCSPLPS